MSELKPNERTVEALDRAREWVAANDIELFCEDGRSIITLEGLEKLLEAAERGKPRYAKTGPFNRPGVEERRAEKRRREAL